MKGIPRRRLITGGSALALVLGIVIALSLGSGGSRPRARGSASVTGKRSTSSALHHAAGASPFQPVPAALSLAARLPLERQVAQLFVVSVGGKSVSATAARRARDWGGVVLDSSNFLSDSQVSALAGQIRAAVRSARHVAPLIAATQEGGPNTAIGDLPPKPEPAIGASGRPVLARTQALAAGRGLRRLGFNMTLAPLADVDIPSGSLSGRLFSGDPAAVARFSSAAVDGYLRARLISAVGHFPGAGGASADPDQTPATVGGSLRDLRARDLIPFAAVAPKAPVIVMSNASYAAFDGVTPASLLPAAVQLLRRGYGFQGVVMSDDLDATLQATGADPGSVALQALQAGDDLLYISGPPSEHQQAYARVLAGARSSAAVRSRVRDALLRVLSLKAGYGLVR